MVDPQAPAILVSQVRSAKAAPLTGSGKVPRGATVPAVDAGLKSWELRRDFSENNEGLEGILK